MNIEIESQKKIFSTKMNEKHQKEDTEIEVVFNQNFKIEWINIKDFQNEIN